MFISETLTQPKLNALRLDIFLFLLRNVITLSFSFLNIISLVIFSKVILTGRIIAELIKALYLLEREMPILKESKYYLIKEEWLACILNK